MPQNAHADLGKETGKWDRVDQHPYSGGGSKVLRIAIVA
jgi:hypothetical protein